MISSQETLVVALIITLSSNAVLLLVLLLKPPNAPYLHDFQEPVTLDQTKNHVSLYRGNDEQLYLRHLTDLAPSRLIKNSKHPWQRKLPTTDPSDVLYAKDYSSKLHSLLDMLAQCEYLQKGTGALNVPDFFSTTDSFKKHIRPAKSHTKYRYLKDSVGRDGTIVPGLSLTKRVRSARTRNSLIPSYAKTLKNAYQDAETYTKDTRKLNYHSNQLNVSRAQEMFVSDLPSKRAKRQANVLSSDTKQADVIPNDKKHTDTLPSDKKQADVPPSKTSSSGMSDHRVHEIFSTFNDQELDKFDSAVYDILIPALVHFETMIIREFESLHSVIVAHDLRLEKIENAYLNNANSNSAETQSDSTDNKSEPNSPLHILGGKEGLLPAGNISEILEVRLEVDGSGEGEGGGTLTSTLSPQTTVHNVAFYDLYRIVSTMEQKVMVLENYNVMSDSELTRVRSEVVKMDDRVTELDRRQRNLQIRTAMHTQKITELEVYMSKSELGIHTALDSYSRVNSRLDVFKDKLAEFKSDLQAVSVQFGRHDQISNELRAADSYKAHDIQEIRKSVFGIEGRLNGLYRVLDHNLDTVRNDLRAMLDRLCANNKLAC